MDLSQSLAFCGINCPQCPCYLGTVSGDTRLLEETAAKWGALSDPPERYSVTDMVCLGCRAGSTTFMFSRCKRCEIRPCAIERGVTMCAACGSFDECDRMRRFYEHSSKARHVLSLLRQKIRDR